MDILYVIGCGSNWDNNELRYSLRSIERFGRNVGRVFIAGYCPDFIDQSVVTWIPCPDEYDFKHKNILRCIEKAVAESDIADDFLYSSDDHFYIAETDFDQYPIFRKGALPSKRKPEDGEFDYNTSLVATHKLLTAAGLTTHNFSWHGNTHFNKTLFNEPQFAAMRELSYGLTGGVEPTCLMLNYMLAKRPFEWVQRHDRKYGDETTREEFFNGLDENRECFSCSPNVMRTYLATYLAEQFPNKSKYERW